MNITWFNLLWGLLFCLVNFVMVIAAYWLFGRTGLFVFIAVATIIANIQVTKTIELFGFAATLGNVFYGSVFLCTDILNERYGKKEADRSVWLGFFANLVLIVAMQMALVFRPMEGVDIADEPLHIIFGLIPRICLGSLAAYLVSQFLDIAIFDKIKKKNEGRLVWVRNNVATMISQLFDTLIFVSIAFIGVYPILEVGQIFVTTYLLKFAVALVDTPFLYLARRLKGGVLTGENSNIFKERMMKIKDRTSHRQTKPTETRSDDED